MNRFNYLNEDAAPTSVNTPNPGFYNSYIQPALNSSKTAWTDLDWNLQHPIKGMAIRGATAIPAAAALAGGIAALPEEAVLGGGAALATGAAELAPEVASGLGGIGAAVGTGAETAAAAAPEMAAASGAGEAIANNAGIMSRFLPRAWQVAKIAGKAGVVGKAIENTVATPSHWQNMRGTAGNVLAFTVGPELLQRLAQKVGLADNPWKPNPVLMTAPDGKTTVSSVMTPEYSTSLHDPKTGEFLGWQQGQEQQFNPDPNYQQLLLSRLTRNKQDAIQKAANDKEYNKSIPGQFNSFLNANPNALKYAGYGAAALGAAGLAYGGYKLIKNVYDKYNWKHNGCNGIEDPSGRVKCQMYLYDSKIADLKSAMKHCQNSDCIQLVQNEIGKNLEYKDKLSLGE